MDLTLRQKIGLAIMGTKAIQGLPAPILRAMSTYMGINAPVYQLDNPELYIKLGYNYNADVFSIVSWIASKAASLDFGVKIYRNGELIETTNNHPLIDLIYNPNPLFGKAEFFENLFGYYLTTGNDYIYAPRLPDGRTKELWGLPSQFTTIRSSGSITTGAIEGYTVGYNEQVKLEAKDVLHHKSANLTWENGEAFYGMSPLRASWRLLQQSNANTDAAVSGHQSLGLKGVLVNKSDTNAWTDEQAATIEANFYKKYGKSSSSRKISITNGDVAWHQIGLSPIDQALIQDSEATMRRLCAAYKVSSRLFNDPQASTYNNLETDVKRAYNDAILPMVKSWCDAFNKWIAQSYAKAGYYIELYPVTDNIPELQEDMGKLATWLGAATWIQFNEKRKAMGFDEDPNMEGKYIIPMGVIITDGLESPFEMPEPPENA